MLPMSVGQPLLSRNLLLLLAGLAVLLAIVCPHSFAQDRNTLLVFGDSLSAAYGIKENEGWVVLLQNRLNDGQYPFTVINASVSGETSTGGLARLPAALKSHQPDIVLLELGGNDGLRGIPLNILKHNLLQMIDLCDSAGAEVLLAGTQIPPNYGPRYTVPFFRLFGEIAQETDVPLVPFLIDGIPQQPGLMQDDGIHPTAAAQAMITDNVWPHLEPMLHRELRGKKSQ